MADYVIPGNDDAIRAIRLVTQKFGDAILEVKPYVDAAARDEEGEGEGDMSEGAVQFGEVEEEFMRSFNEGSRSTEAKSVVADNSADELDEDDDKVGVGEDEE